MEHKEDFKERPKCQHCSKAFKSRKFQYRLIMILFSLQQEILKCPNTSYLVCPALKTIYNYMLVNNSC